MKQKLPDGKTLFEEMQKSNGNMCEVARKYNASDKGIAYALKSGGYPFHSKDYREQKDNSKYYKRERCEYHPKYGKNKYIPTHILVAEKILGRHLKPEEVVHHIDENKQNNNENNIIVFATKSDHVAFHNGNKKYKVGDVWKAERIEIKHECEYCHKIYTTNNSIRNKQRKYCSDECAKEARKYTNDELQDIILLLYKYNGNFSQVARLYNLTPNAIVRRLKTNNLPFHSKDYRQ